MYIGPRIKELREAQGLKLIDLAEKSGVQIATLSRIEHMKMVGSLESHMAIAKALEVDITALYTNIIKKEDLLSLKTPKTMTDLFVGSEKSSYEILTSKIFSKKMMPILLKIEPNGRTNNEHNRPGTEKFIYVLDGKIDIKIKEETFTLGKNNTLYFDASADHYIMNKGTAVAKVIVIATPVVL